MFKNILLTKIKQRNIFIPVLIIIIACSSLIIINYITLKILSANRAYINGESQYSKAQKEASRHLVTYIFNQDVKDWNLFKRELAVPQGDAAARIALTNNGSLETIKAGFKAGRNNPKDFDDLIWLFKKFKSVEFFATAINEWKNADLLINQLSKTGVELNQKIETNTLTEADKSIFLEKINQLSKKLSVSEHKFSASL